LYVALTHAPNRTVRDRSTFVQPLGALHIVSMLCLPYRDCTDGMSHYKMAPG